jgi:hypothetical protein
MPAAPVETERLDLVENESTAVHRLHEASVGAPVDVAEAVLADDETVGTEGHRDGSGGDATHAQRFHDLG